MPSATASSIAAMIACDVAWVLIPGVPETL